jgi:hypothetical protein
MATYDHVVAALETLLVRVGESARDLIDLEQIEIAADRGHNVAPDREAWVNTLLRALCTLKAQLAGERQVTAAAVAHCLGEASETLCGGRCLTCGYADVRFRDIDAYVAARVVRGLVPDAVASGVVDGLLRVALLGEAVEADAERVAIGEAIVRCGIEISPRGGPLDHCPSCEGDATIAYRWRMNVAGRLEATRDNVPLRVAG